MKLPAIALALVLAAGCGGPSKPTAGPGNTGGTAPTTAGVPAEWTAVFVKGASFTLDNSTPDAPADDPMVIHITVGEVTQEGDNRRAELRWHDASGEDVMTNGGPLIVQVGPAGVWFWTGGEEIEPVLAGPPTYPAGSDKTLRDGYYDVVHRRDDGTVCYGWEPGPDAGECEDVCYSDLCVDPTDGIIGGSGTWWPNAEMFDPAK